MSGDVYAITELDTGSIAEKLANELELELIQTHMTVVSKGSQSRSYVWVCITLMVIKIQRQICSVSWLSVVVVPWKSDLQDQQ